ncbi:O-succinylhomoserine sulfhydrylase [Roseivirga ehrenbergii]|uniref:O-succinylhomoserine sulfhydrylase n=1 Tax=Roseivirga ehrenbergii (strain DSM 102268 / JCM 13514 / KCTC 12282 / NCIMB 14502 / KMM 6017) TaxID=279360 RepID=A0A150WXR0_ROSEK|nr:aminotransferase class I/II-fold pyridoxal phosphate-dependent enzyme [Roseivirga ehrenbergii]KYG71267.1 O-succinylhomoserine sulfhydrylase [Roseivirga ehrenbergii]TCK99696.1 O-succinylhomoserine sulfhydrylase [Roseivirga ehrenbergii]
MKEKQKQFETEAIRTQIEGTHAQEHSTPMYLTSSFTYEDAEEMRAAFAGENDKNIYSRFSNPNLQELVDKVCKMEKAEAGYAFASGMAAIFSTFAALLSSGDHIISCRSIFGSTHTVLGKILSKWKIDTTYVDIDNTSDWDNAVQPNSKILYVETPTNPAVDIIDLEWLGHFAKKHKLILVVDNCFATPYLQQPIQYGADLVIHSATKFMDGQGRVMGGITVGKKELIDEIYAFSRSTGPALSAFNAWVISKSLETLAVRMDRHSENALKLAEFLENSEFVEWVKYPFLKSHPMYEVAKKQMKAGGAMVAFGIKGGLESGRVFLNNIKICSLTANLGDSRTIVTHPSSTTHAKLSEEERIKVGITPELIRVSVGLEHITDIITDIEQALKAAQ